MHALSAASRPFEEARRLVLPHRVPGVRHRGHDAADDFDFAGPATFEGLPAALSARLTVATGRPRLVTVTVPCLSMSSSTARHLALNSVALRTRCFIRIRVAANRVR